MLFRSIRARRDRADLPGELVASSRDCADQVAIRSKGVAALLSKSDRLDDIASAVRAIKAGETYMSASVVRLLGLAAGSVREGGLLALTEKEIEVLRLFVSGSTISEIAAKRERSVKTISHQKMSAMHKLGIRNDPELYNYAHEHGLG